MTFESTAIYPNRLEDKLELESKLSLAEQGNEDINFYLPDGSLLAKGYERIVYGDHGPYIEYRRDHLKCKMYSKFGNVINYRELPDLDYKYYYFWLYPSDFENIKIYLQIKPVTNLPNAPKRIDGKKSDFNRTEGYADYKRGYFYISPYEVKIPKVVHCKKEPYDVYIGRGSKWGNPYSHKEGTMAAWVVDTREQAILLYEEHIRSQPELMDAAIKELRGKILGCYCKPLDCHGDVLLKIANE
jgi:hypothetical protein